MLESLLSGFEAWVPGIGITGILVFLITGFTKNWLLTRGQVEWIVEGLKTAASDAKEREKEWKAAYDAAFALNQVQTKQIDTLLTSAETTNRLLTALKDEIGRGGNS